MTVLTGDQIIKQGIVTDLIDADLQTQMAGIDLTVQKVERFTNSGWIDFDNSRRTKPNLEEIGLVTMKRGDEDPIDVSLLGPGCYLITFNEIVDVPKDCIGLARPRSSLLRAGATIFSSLWDPGYKGRSSSLLVVHNLNGLVITKNARLMQIIFLRLDKEAEKLYSGIYQNENI